MPEADRDPFAQLLADLSDGRRWELIQAEEWDDFVAQLTETITKLEPRRRQAVLMLLFALVKGLVTADAAKQWMDGRDMDQQQTVEDLIAWLRSRR